MLVSLKVSFMTIIAGIGATLSYFLGGWVDGLIALCILMVIDYVSGLIVAGVFKKSTKTETGGLSSKTGLKGLCKKIGILFIVLFSSQIDRLLSTNFVMTGVIIAFVVNEGLSIIENCALMGIPIPSVITKSLDVLKNKGEKL